MKKKSITPAVLAANRANAQSSTGPRTEQGKANSSRNAVKHGILASKIVLDSEEQRADFCRLLNSCKTDCAPQGLFEKYLVEEIAMLFWKLGIIEELEAKELLRRQELSDNLVSIFDKDLELPIDGFDLPLDRGWDCEKIVVRAVAGQGTSDSTASRLPKMFQGRVVPSTPESRQRISDQTGTLEVEAFLESSLGKMTRYRSGLKRELYRAIELLRKIQSERKARGKSAPNLRNEPKHRQAKATPSPD